MASIVKGLSCAAGVIAVIYITDMGYWGCKDSLRKLLRFYTLASLGFTTYFYFYCSSKDEEEVPVLQDPPPIDSPPQPEGPPPLEPPPQAPPPINCPPAAPRAPTPPPAEPNLPHCIACDFSHAAALNTW